MEEVYDVIVLGTGLTECILSGLLSVNGSKVLHVDRNDYYGGECASLNLSQVYEYFHESPSEQFGNPRRFNVDLVPKFLMADGKLVKILLHTDVTRYLEFKSVDGSYVVKKGKVFKVPATQGEALNSKLLGLLEKNRFKNCLDFIVEYETNDTSTQKGIPPDAPTSQLMKKFSLGSGTCDFLGHAIALYRDESWQESPVWETIQRVRLYNDSLSHYGTSPYLYPLYGLGDLPQGFARLSAIYGGTYMLNKPVDGFTYDDKGRVNGVISQGETARCNAVIGDPSYFPDKVEQVGEVVRLIGIMDHPVPSTNDSQSCQIIIPQNQAGRHSDIYINVVSFQHQVAPNGMYLVYISTTVETNNPEAELQLAVDLCGGLLKSWCTVKPVFKPVNDPQKDGIYISNSYDSTAHFSTICDDVIRLYQLVSGLEDVSHILIPKVHEEDPQEL